MATGTPLTASEIQTLRNRANLHAAARKRVVVLEKENKELKNRLEDSEKENEELRRKLGESEKKVTEQADANKKLRHLLFSHDKPHRTKREKATVARTAESYRRKKPAYITERKTLTLTDCPDCRGAVSGMQSSRTRLVEDIVFSPQPTVTQWTINRHYCAGCKKLVEGTIPNFLPNTTLGPNTLCFVLIARYRWNMPYEKIKDTLLLSFGLTISEGEIAHLLKTAADLLGAKWDEIVAAVKAGAVVHCDETGWHINGTRVWAHTFATAKAVLYDILPTRGKGVAVARLGSAFTGVRVSDCLPNYKNLPGDHQICWAHLTREAGENRDREPDNFERRHLHGALGAVYRELIGVTGSWDKVTAAATKVACEKAVTQLIALQWDDPASRRLVNRLQDFRHALFTCLDHPGVPPDNNHAERVLRKLAVQRKISGGNRSIAHAGFHAKLMSVMETLRLEGENVRTSLQTLLQGGIALRLSGE